MQYHASLGRSLVLALSLLSACAAADPSAATNGSSSGDPAHQGAASAYLTGRFAAQQGDMAYGADQFLRALANDPRNPDLIRQALLATILAGRPEAADLARQLPDDPAAQLLLADIDARRGNWEAARDRYAALPKQGITEILSPLLTAWAEYGAGRPDAALSELHPYVDNTRIRAVFTLHDALIADLAGHSAEAGRLYSVAQTEFGAPNFELVRALASWQFRHGHEAEARRTLAAVAEMGDELAVSTPRLTRDAAAMPVRNAADGIAEVYLAFAVLLRQQDAGEFANMLLRFALDLRPDFTSARLVMAEGLEVNHEPDAALALLAPVAANDLLAPSVDLRRAALYDQLGNTDEALHLLDTLAAAWPDRPEPWTLRGSLLRARHRYAESVAAFTKALALMGPPARAHWPIYYERGIAEERSHQWPAAEADFQKALDLSPDEPSVLNYLGYSWTEQGRNLPRAYQMIKRAAELRPNDGAITDSLGWVELHQGDVTAAVRWLEQAVELLPEDPTINGHLGDAYWAAGRKLEALYQWRRAMTLNPEPDDAAHIQERLREAERAEGIASAAAAAAKPQP